MISISWTRTRFLFENMLPSGGEQDNQFWEQDNRPGQPDNWPGQLDNWPGQLDNRSWASQEVPRDL